MNSLSNKLKSSVYKKAEDIEKNIIKEEPPKLPTKEIAISAPNSIVPSSFFTGGLSPLIQNYLPTELELTETEMEQVSNSVKRRITGLNCSVPVQCYGEKCPFRRDCALFNIGKAPKGHPCPLETMVMDLHTKRYLDEFQVDPDNFSEVTTMTQLAATHVMELRAFMSLGQDTYGDSLDGLIRNVVGYSDEDGTPITQLQEHPAYNIIERAWRWRAKLLESLGGTRKDKQKASGTVELSGGYAEDAARLRQMLSNMNKIPIQIN